jgi:hypothetical protein
MYGRSRLFWTLSLLNQLNKGARHSHISPNTAAQRRQTYKNTVNRVKKETTRNNLANAAYKRNYNAIMGGLNKIRAELARNNAAIKSYKQEKRTPAKSQRIGKRR